MDFQPQERHQGSGVTRSTKQYVHGPSTKKRIAILRRSHSGPIPGKAPERAIILGPDPRGQRQPRQRVLHAEYGLEDLLGCTISASHPTRIQHLGGRPHSSDFTGFDPERQLPVPPLLSDFIRGPFMAP